MNYRKIILSFVILVILAVIGFGYYKYGDTRHITVTEETNNTGIDNKKENPNTTLPETPIPTANLPIKERAWSVLESYLKAAKEHNLPEIKRLSHQISDVCNDPLKTVECDSRMDTVYFFGSAMKKSEFVNVWSDSKQIILSTNLRREEDKDAIFLSRGIIYFTFDESGNIKLLKFNDSKGVSMRKEGRTVEEINSYLQKQMLDEDQDGIEDEIELCVGQPETCVKTDPKKRDSNADGFWDGVEAQFYK